MTVASSNHSFVKNSCLHCANKNCLINQSLHLKSVLKFTENKKELKCKKGQQFILEGASVTGLFVLLSGKVKVSRTGIYEKEQIVRFASEGEIIGHRGFTTEESYPINATALEDSILCYFSKETLQQVLKIEPLFTYKFMLFYANELGKSEIRVKLLSQMTVRERVIDTLLYVQRKFGQNQGFISIILSRREYADYAGTTEEQVIRTLSSLKNENLIRTKGKRIGIESVQLLQKEISEHNFYLG